MSTLNNVYGKTDLFSTQQVLTIHMDVDGKEFRRTVETVSFEESRIKNADLTRYCGQGIGCKDYCSTLF